jgi:hypothetical protein
MMVIGRAGQGVTGGTRMGTGTGTGTGTGRGPVNERKRSHRRTRVSQMRGFRLDGRVIELVWLTERKDLGEMELMYGELKMGENSGLVTRAGFGPPDQVVQLTNGAIYGVVEQI